MSGGRCEAYNGTACAGIVSWPVYYDYEHGNDLHDTESCPMNACSITIYRVFTTGPLRDLEVLDSKLNTLFAIQSQSVAAECKLLDAHRCSPLTPTTEH
jgi:hypothetical protein